MKTLGTFLLALIIACNLAIAQDTLYIYRGGYIVTMRPLAQIDSITFYKNPVSLQPEIVTDFDGNEYHSVKIGTQIWMQENLKTKHFRNGDEIGTTTPATKNIVGESTPIYQWAHNGNESNVPSYGRLYTWFAVNDNRMLAPAGWHVPTDAEWTTLADYLTNTGYGYDGSGNDISKSLAATSSWNLCTVEGAPGNEPAKNNSSGFTALAGGFRDKEGWFDPIGILAFRWSSTENNDTGGKGRLMHYNTNLLWGQDNWKSSGFSVRCIKDTGSVVLLPTLSTLPITGITQTTAFSGGNITNDGGATITMTGVCWNTTGSPTIADSKVSDTTRMAKFTNMLIGLLPNTLYHVRAFATNSVGTAYGEQISLTTLSVPEGMVVDFDGNLYHTVTIGTQVWMMENLNTTHYRNGVPIPIVTEKSAWDVLASGAYCNANNDTANARKYGRLYNWYAATDTCHLAPLGWHVPDTNEWGILSDYLTNIGDGFEGSGNDIAKSLASTSGWPSSSTAGAVGNIQTSNNKSGFSALPGGYRDFNYSFLYVGEAAFWWTTTDVGSDYVYSKHLIYNDANFSGGIGQVKRYGNSVRCVRDLSAPIVVPTLSTTAVGDRTSTFAMGGGKITFNGGAPLTAYGVCWNTTGDPTIADSRTVDSINSVSFTSTLTGLTSNTKYYVRAYATNSAGTAYGEQVSFSSDPAIGDRFQGGITAYILQPTDLGYSANETRGLIAAPSDQSSSAEWGCIDVGLCSERQASGTAYGKGNQNTVEIMSGCATAGIAARICGDLVLGGYSDWFLPSMGELNKLYINKTAIGGFANAGYWSSSEGTTWYSYEYDFRNGDQNYPNKDYLFHVRAVRTFTIMH